MTQRAAAAAAATRRAGGSSERVASRGMRRTSSSSLTEMRVFTPQPQLALAVMALASVLMMTLLPTQTSAKYVHTDAVKHPGCLRSDPQWPRGWRSCPGVSMNQTAAGMYDFARDFEPFNWNLVGPAWDAYMTARGFDTDPDFRMPTVSYMTEPTEGHRYFQYQYAHIHAAPVNKSYGALIRDTRAEVRKRRGEGAVGVFF